MSRSGCPAERPPDGGVLMEEPFAVAIGFFPTAYAISMPELARACEDRGIESLWVTEHTHIPTSRQSPWPGGVDLPKQYLQTLDPFVALAAAASVTSRLRLATGICLVVERDPIILAKEVASLDVLSGGRFLFGVGAGWNHEEMRDHGTDPSTRFALMRERIQAMKRIWAEDEPEFHGRFVDFDPMWSWPKPVQQPHPPIVLGGDGPRVLERVIEYGDAWMPIHGRSDVPLATRIEELNRLAREAGRTPIPVSVFGVPPKREVIDAYRAMGVHRVIVAIPSRDADDVLPRLDAIAGIVTA